MDTAASEKVVAKQSGEAAVSFRLWVVLIQKLALALLLPK